MKVRIAGGRQAYFDQTIDMPKKDFERLSKALASDDQREAERAAQELADWLHPDEFEFTDEFDPFEVAFERVKPERSRK